jgi:hypothetical protein
MNPETKPHSSTPARAVKGPPGLEVKASDKVALALIGLLGTLVTGVFTVIMFALRGS